MLVKSCNEIGMPACIFVSKMRVKNIVCFAHSPSWEKLNVAHGRIKIIAFIRVSIKIWCEFVVKDILLKKETVLKLGSVDLFSLTCAFYTQHLTVNLEYAGLLGLYFQSPAIKMRDVNLIRFTPKFRAFCYACHNYAIRLLEVGT